MSHADERRRLLVRANADTGEDAARARRFGAQGIGLCRTEHMFLGDRRATVERLVLAATDDEREAALDELLPLQRGDFIEIFTAMAGLPVTIRLLDPPLHEFLPDLTELSVKVASAERTASTSTRTTRLLAAVRRLHEENPMLGLRGVRLGHRRSRACSRCRCGRSRRRPPSRGRGRRPAAADHGPAGRRPCGSCDRSRDGGRRGGRRGRRGQGVELGSTIGTMIELPRAALTAGRDRRGRGLLLLRHERPDADDLGLLPRRRRGARSSPRYLEPGIFDGRRRSRRSTATASAGWCGSRSSEGRAARPGLELGRLRGARRRPRVGALLPRGRPGLRVLLAVPGAGRAPGGGPGGGGRRGRRRYRLTSWAPGPGERSGVGSSQSTNAASAWSGTRPRSVRPPETSR